MTSFGGCYFQVPPSLELIHFSLDCKKRTISSIPQLFLLFRLYLSPFVSRLCCSWIASVFVRHAYSSYLSMNRQVNGPFIVQPCKRSREHLHKRPTSGHVTGVTTRADSSGRVLSSCVRHRCDVFLSHVMFYSGKWSDHTSVRCHTDMLYGEGQLTVRHFNVFNSSVLQYQSNVI